MQTSALTDLSFFNRKYAKQKQTTCTYISSLHSLGFSIRYPLWISSMTSLPFIPGYGLDPRVTISHSNTPNAQTSDFVLKISYIIKFTEVFKAMDTQLLKQISVLEDRLHYYQHQTRNLKNSRGHYLRSVSIERLRLWERCR